VVCSQVFRLVINVLDCAFLTVWCPYDLCLNGVTFILRAKSLL
jgi:hypothetical protein